MIRRALRAAASVACLPAIVVGATCAGAVIGLVCGVGLACEIVPEIRRPREPMRSYDG